MIIVMIIIFRFWFQLNGWTYAKNSYGNYQWNYLSKERSVGLDKWAWSEFQNNKHNRQNDKYVPNFTQKASNWKINHYLIFISLMSNRNFHTSYWLLLCNAQKQCFDLMSSMHATMLYVVVLNARIYKGYNSRLVVLSPSHLVDTT